MISRLDDFHKDRISLEEIRRVWTELSQHQKMLGAIFALVALQAALGLVQPVVTRLLIDRALLNRDVNLFIIFFLVNALVSLGEHGVSTAREYLSGHEGRRIVVDVRGRLYSSLRRQSYRFFLSSEPHDSINSMHESSVLGQSLISLEQFCLCFFKALGAIALMAYWDIRLALLVCAFAPVHFYLRYRHQGAQSGSFQDVYEAGKSTFDVARYTLSREAFLVAAHPKTQAAYDADFHVSSERHAEALRRQSAVPNVWMGFEMIGTDFALLSLYLCAGILMTTGKVSLGTLFAFLALASQFVGSIQGLAMWPQRLREDLLRWRGMFRILDLEPEVQESPKAVPVPPLDGGIRFENVHFAYQPDYPVLRGVSFEARPGKFLALVGRSGAGKTTTAYLMQRFFDPTSGKVALAGQDLKDFQIASVRQAIAFVPAGGIVFDMSVRRNMLLGNPAASDDDIVGALRQAQVDEVVLAHPKGLDAIIGDGGLQFSSGEVQRLSIARALLMKPRALILDEPTSMLDSLTERLLKETLRKLVSQNVALVVIAHRLTTVLAANEILLFEDGQIVERGTNKHLLTRDGLYSQVYREQFEPQEKMLADMGLTS